ncbi:MAG: response regulator transcription factor [Anaerolineae bacterium]
MMVKILLADDHTLVRAGFRALLQSLPDLEVVAEAADGAEALRLVELHQPELVLMDIGMRGLNGLEATARISQEFPQVKVIILSIHASEEYVLRALRAGAKGYLLKDANMAELETAITTVMAGDDYLSPAVSKQLADYIRHMERDVNPADLLTPRQREVFQLIAKGRTTKEIAQTLGIGVKTVETHRTQLMERLDIHDIAGLVRYAIRTGLITPE